MELKHYFFALLLFAFAVQGFAQERAQGSVQAELNQAKAEAQEREEAEALARVFPKGELYTFAKLSQEGINVVATPMPSMPRESGDTSFTVWEGSTVPLVHYFVHGDQYDNVFNPHPTGIYLNNQEFHVFCDDELAVRQQVNMFLDAREFTFLSKRYLALISLWENCDGATCRYRCYNVFDITDPNNIKQNSFNSIFEGMDSFGEFNNDGIIDYLRAAPNAPEGAEEEGTADYYYYITAYSLTDNGQRQLLNDQHSNYYLYGFGDDYVESFKVLEADWFNTITDTSGAVATHKPYFAPYISFDPYESYLYDRDGFRQEKRRYSIHVNTLGDVDGAIEEVNELRKELNQNVYILPDQYSGDVTFRVLVGNFMSKDVATDLKTRLADIGIDGKLFNFKGSW
jgi:hypothetical protein